MLIAEDHPGVAKAVCRVLSLDCDVVGTVADGSEVLEAVRQLHPDAIRMDRVFEALRIRPIADHQPVQDLVGIEHQELALLDPFLWIHPHRRQLARFTSKPRIDVLAGRMPAL